MPKIARSQVIKTLSYCAGPVVLCSIWYGLTFAKQPLFIMFFTTLIAFIWSLPGVSKADTLGKAFGVIVAYNAPLGTRQIVLDALTGDRPAEPPPATPTEPTAEQPPAEA